MPMDTNTRANLFVQPFFYSFSSFIQIVLSFIKISFRIKCGENHVDRSHHRLNSLEWIVIEISALDGNQRTQKNLVARIEGRNRFQSQKLES